MNFMPRRRRKPEIIIVSLIDIFAILLIFMVMTMSFKEERAAVTIKLPEAKTSVVSEKAVPPIVLTVSADEQLFLDAKPVAIDELPTALRELLKKTPNPVLALNADKKAPFGTIIKVLDVLKEAGIKGNMAAFTEMPK